MTTKNFTVAAGCGLLLGVAAPLASAGSLHALPNLDQFRQESSSRQLPRPAGLEGRLAKTIFDQQLGQPTFLWARPEATPIAVGALPTTRDILIEQARSHLRAEAATLGLTEQIIADAKVFDAQYNGNGPAVVRFKQTIAGREVFSRSLNVVIDRVGKPVAVSGYFATGLDAGSLAGPAFPRSAAQAISDAVVSLNWGNALATSLIQPLEAALNPLAGTFQWFKAPALAGGTQAWERMPRAKAIYYPRANGRVVPAYYIELFANSTVDRSSSGYGVVVSAVDGGVLHRRNLFSHAVPFNYTVFADGADNNFHPWDSPLGNGYAPFPGADPLVKLPRVPTVATAPKVTVLASSGLEDPWLADDATTTIGNNTIACIDRVDSPTSGLITSPLINPVLNNCTAAVGDLVPETTGPNTFDHPLVPDEDPAGDTAAAAAAVSLFYINNWMRDWWYVHGFNEESGNAQTSNFGRGGEEGDPLVAQGQDATGRNNANMGTPADGSSPIMQQYLFDGPVIGAVRQVAPSEISYVFGPASFGPDDYDVPATSVVQADDGFETPSLSDGCGEMVPLPDPTGLGLVPTHLPAPPSASLQGQIVLLDRGNCNFTTKARFAQLSGAAAMIVVNNSGGEPISMGNADLPIDVPVPPLPSPLPNVPLNTNFTYTIPSVMIRKADGDAIKALLAEGVEVQVALQRQPAIDLDGTLDNQIVAHEFFHYVHHRLTDSSNQQSGAMSEGWGDINGFMFSVRPEDRLQPGNDRWQGAYSLAGYVTDAFYSGIRRVPYSTDMAKNAYTLKHIAEGEPTPEGGPGTGNSGVHNGGEIWANQMWECYAGLLNAHPFDDARSRMKDYIISGFKATPADATYVEARDAVLSAIKAVDDCDYMICANAFAKRGNGPDAVAPPRGSTDLVGVTEDFTPFGALCPTSVTPPVTPPVTPTPTPNPVTPVVEGGRFGGGALSLLMLLPLLGFGLMRKRRH